MFWDYRKQLEQQESFIKTLESKSKTKRQTRCKKINSFENIYKFADANIVWNVLF